MDELENNKTEVEDQGLISLIQKGDRQAFTRVYNKYHKMLYGLALRYLKNEELAKDAVQYTFTKLWEKHKIISIEVSLRNYLYTITRNHILNQIRKNKVEIAHHYQELQGDQVAIEDTLQIMDNDETIQAFRDAIQKLPERKREICLLKIREQLTHSEIAEQLNISLSTVKIDFIQSKELLRRQLKKVFLF